MTIWKITITDEEYYGTKVTYQGLATSVKKAIDKAVGLAKKDNPDCKKLYVQTVECLGDTEF